MADNKPSRLHVEFFTDAVENKLKSKAEGRPIFEDKEFVRIKFPGDKNRELVAPAKDGYRRDQQDKTHWVTYAEDYPEHYAAFKRNEKYLGEGTPLSELPWLTESRRAEFRALNIDFAEQLAGLDGAFLTRLGMGGRADKDRAQAWLDKAKGSALETRMAAENAELRDQMALMQQQMNELLAGPAPAVQSTVPVSEFQDWADPDIKEYILKHTGSKPKGNPSHNTLVSAADEIAATLNKVAA